MSQPLLIEWSPTQVRVFDPVTRAVTEGGTIAACATGGREAIVGVAQRSSFIRTIPVPTADREEIAKLLPFKIGATLPLPMTEVAYGFRVARDPQGDGRAVVVGAVKTESLRRIHEDARTAGITIRAVTPAALGSWLAAKSTGMTDGAVVTTTPDTTSIDVIRFGELVYSRSIATPETEEEIQEEIETTFCLAKAPIGSVLRLGTNGTDRRLPVEFLADPRSVFTLELPERIAARRERAVKATARRAIAALLVMGIVGAYAIAKRTTAENNIRDDIARQSHSERLAKLNQTEAVKLATSVGGTAAMLDTAFRPAQTFGDVIAAMGTETPPGIWLTGMTLERGKPILLNGQATNGKAVAAFVAKLAANPRFREMKLVFANKGMIGERPIVQFGISGRAVGNLPIEVKE